MKLATLLLSGALLSAVFAGCSSDPNANGDQICKPDAYVFCRCQDRQEGQKLCNQDGTAFGKCEPCESYDNPEYIEGSSGSSSGEYPPIDEDGGASSSGNPPSCGDGIVQDGEDCDDKDTDDADGCGASCKLSGTNPPATNSCPGLEVHVWGGAHKPTLTATTTGAGDRSVTPTCPKSGAGASASGAAAPDRVFKVVAHETGTLKVSTADANFNVFLYAVADGKCSGGTVAQIACRNAVDGNGNETLTLPVDAGKTYHVFVDGGGAGLSGKKEGSFRVTFEIL